MVVTRALLPVGRASQTVAQCEAKCCSLDGCLAFAYVVATEQCHLKNQSTPSNFKPGFKGTTCGIFPANPAPRPTPGPVPPAPRPPAPPVPAPTPGPPDPTAPRPHFLFILQDDLGFDDVGFNNPESAPFSPAITRLAAEGIALTNHYVHWHCSPTRRSFLTGRLPIHHSEQLSGDQNDDMDLRWNLISQKLALAGYVSYWYGKGHTGYKSMAHLPTHRDFKHWTGFMGGAQSYTADKRWQDEAPFNETTYSSDLYGTHTLAAIDTHDASTPMMMYLPWQAVVSGLDRCTPHPFACPDIPPTATATSFLIPITVGINQRPFQPASLLSLADRERMGLTPRHLADPWTRTRHSATIRMSPPHTPIPHPPSPIPPAPPSPAKHAPYDVPPASDGAPNGTAVQQMLWSADQYVGKVVALLKQKSMWGNTLVVYTADNGGTADGCTFPGDGKTMCGGTNYPKRGNKHTNWQGGMNGAAFVSGGFIPAALRGTHSDVAMHIVDWYATFCALAGVDADDVSGVPPLPIDPDLPPTLPPPKDIYGSQSWPNMDGVNVWPLLTAGSTDRGAAHRSLTLSREVLLINGTFKLVVAQPDPGILAHKEGMPPVNNYMVGWRARNQTWQVSSAYDKSGCGLTFIRNESFNPCLVSAPPPPGKNPPTDSSFVVHLTPLTVVTTARLPVRGMPMVALSSATLAPS